MRPFLKKFCHIMTLTALAVTLIQCRDKGRKAASPEPGLPYDYDGYFVRPANPESPYKDIDVAAQFVERKDIPYIDVSTGDPVQTILNHTFVSHLWMVGTFEQLLRTMPEPVLRLAQCTKLILIDGRDPGSHQGGQRVTLAGHNFARTDEQKQQINAPIFSIDTKKKIVWTRMSSFQLPWRDERALDDDYVSDHVLLETFAHELFHACDEKAKPYGTYALSTALTTIPANPAQEYFMGLIGAPAYQDALTRYSVEQVGAAHMKTTAAGSYDYFSHHEHFAELATVLLLKKVFERNRYEYYYERADDGGPNKMLWGIKDKICQNEVKEEALKALRSTGLFPDLDFSAMLENCSPQFLQTGLPIETSLRSADKANSN